MELWVLGLKVFTPPIKVVEEGSGGSSEPRMGCNGDKELWALDLKASHTPNRGRPRVPPCLGWAQSSLTPLPKAQSVPHCPPPHPPPASLVASRSLLFSPPFGCLGR